MESSLLFISSVCPHAAAAQTPAFRAAQPQRAITAAASSFFQPQPLRNARRVPIQQSSICLPLICSLRDHRKNSRSTDPLQPGGYGPGVDMPRRRPNRVAELVKRELGKIIPQQFDKQHPRKSPFLKDIMFSVIRTHMADDLRNCTVDICVHGEKKSQRAYGLSWLKKQRKTVRYLLASNLNFMKRIPDLHFRESEVVDAFRTLNLINKLEKERLGREAGNNKEAGEQTVVYEKKNVKTAGVAAAAVAAGAAAAAAAAGLDDLELSAGDSEEDVFIGSDEEFEGDSDEDGDEYTDEEDSDEDDDRWEDIEEGDADEYLDEDDYDEDDDEYDVEDSEDYEDEDDYADDEEEDSDEVYEEPKRAPNKRPPPPPPKPNKKK